MKLIIHYIGRHKKMFFTALFFLGLETLADLLQPTFMSYIVDNGVKENDVGKIMIYCAIMLLIAAFGALGGGDAKYLCKPDIPGNRHGNAQRYLSKDAYALL